MAETNSTLAPMVGAEGELGPDELDALLGVLGDARRRLVLDELFEATEPVAFDDLAAAVARREAADDAVADVDRVRLSLLHVHLPKLADAGVARFDADARLVALAEDREQTAHLAALRAAVERVARAT